MSMLSQAVNASPAADHAALTTTLALLGALNPEAKTFAPSNDWPKLPTAKQLAGPQAFPNAFQKAIPKTRAQGRARSFRV
jgi:hypothetical protein